MPFIMGNYLELWQFLRKQQVGYDYSDRAWVQQLDRVDKCTTFIYQTIEIDYCAQPSPFICEIGKFYYTYNSRKMSRYIYIYFFLNARS